MFSARKR